MKINFYNIFITSDFETEIGTFECVFDSSKLKNKKINTITHILSTKTHLTWSILFEDSRTILDDYCLLLSVFQWNYVTYENANFLPCMNKVNDFELFLSDEVWDFLDKSIQNLQSLKDKDRKKFNTIQRSIFLYYEAKYLLIYNESDILFIMHIFEYLLWSIMRINNNIAWDIKIQESYSYMCSNFSYQEYIDEYLYQEIKPKPIKKFKRKNKIKSLWEFEEQFRKMRNWIQHWMHWEKPNFVDSPSNTEFTFNYRLQSFIRVILVDLIYWDNYKRKFDILYQLILEENVCFMPTSEFPNKIFKNKK